MPTQNQRECGTQEADVAGSFDLSELGALYGEHGLRTLLAVALDEFDCQYAALDAGLDAGNYARAAEALHRLTGTAAFFVQDERMLEPLHCAERALRLSDVSLAARTLPRARITLAALRGMFAGVLAQPCRP